MGSVAAKAAPAPATTKAKGKKRLTDKQRAERKLAYLLCGPAVFAMLLVTAYPILYALWLSLRKADLRFPDRGEFIGLENYITVLTSSTWWSVLGATLLITIVSVLIELVLGMIFALIMHRAIFGRGPIRASILIPYGIVTVVAALAWQYMFTPGTGFLGPITDAGLLNETFPGQYIAIIATEVWKTTPFMALLLLAGLQTISSDVYEAARVDGANVLQRFFRITLPLLKGTILVAVLFRTLDSYRIFDLFWAMSNRELESLSTFVYKSVRVSQLLFAQGNAASVFIFVTSFLLALFFIYGLGMQTSAEE